MPAASGLAGPQAGTVGMHACRSMQICNGRMDGIPGWSLLKSKPPDWLAGLSSLPCWKASLEQRPAVHRHIMAGPSNQPLTIAAGCAAGAVYRAQWRKNTRAESESRSRSSPSGLNKAPPIKQAEMFPQLGPARRLRYAARLLIAHLCWPGSSVYTGQSPASAERMGHTGLGAYATDEQPA